MCIPPKIPSKCIIVKRLRRIRIKIRGPDLPTSSRYEPERVPVTLPSVAHILLYVPYIITYNETSVVGSGEMSLDLEPYSLYNPESRGTPQSLSY